ncbi:MULTISPECIES: parM protein [Staphylococcus]|uniref:ParM protein n=1 Tax=Staphylococcus equorum TaxID=246432 RepID=A0A9X4LD84_9STAP|nr:MULTISPECIES: parM protein [Staphylococcus]KRG11354.1 parM protein [Staphylococcus sp. NAM3COL9]MDG0844403.1 parM protein [Staphylococcus equorum]MDG0860604.1 parM protein [Staphylococcus equorum]
MSTVYAMALDFGNGFVKGRINNENFIVPSRVGLKSSTTRQLEGFINSDLDVSEFIINNNTDEILLFGKDLDKTTNTGKDTASTNKRYIYKSFEDLVNCSIGLLAREVPEKEIDVVISTGMPSNEIGSKNQAQFEEILRRNRSIEIDGITKIVNVQDIKIIAQPMGTLLDLHMENGKVFKSFTEGKYSVLDFGSGTTIIDTYQNLKRVEEESFVINKGMIDFYKRIATHVSKEAGGDAITPRMIEKGMEYKQCKVNSRLTIDFTDYFYKEQDELIQEVMSNFETVIGNINSIDRIIVTGGGANVHFNSLSHYYPDVFESVEDSQLSNVRGYEKLGELLKAQVEQNFTEFEQTRN